MNPELRLKRFLQVAESHLNRWYIWGGDDPLGFDCSGLVVECLRSVGWIGPNLDLSADGLWQMFQPDENTIPTPGAGAGAMAFWFTGQRATHVAICLDSEYCLTADGGGSHIRTVSDAQRFNAYIKIRPIDHRREKPKFINLFT